MSAPIKRTAFAAIDLVVLIFVAVLLLGLLLPAVSRSEGNQRQELCANKLHVIGIALLNHHDAFKKFPVLSTEPYPQRLGNTAPPITGFSWLVRILPFLEQTELYTQIATKSDKFRPGGVAAFSNALVDVNGRHFATYPLDAFLCWDYPGSPISKLSAQTPYKEVPGQDKGEPPIGIAISNYVALPATDIALMKAVNPLKSDANGVIVPNKGLNLRAITDGTSKTVIVCETLEESLNSWLDGSVNWVVGANPNNAAPPQLDANKYLAVAIGDTTALNVGPDHPKRETRYLTKDNSPNGYEWAWGPSGPHEGVVMHLYADAAARAIQDNVDPTIYVQLITRAGREPVIVPGAGN